MYIFHKPSVCLIKLLIPLFLIFQKFSKNYITSLLSIRWLTQLNVSVPDMKLPFYVFPTFSTKNSHLLKPFWHVCRVQNVRYVRTCVNSAKQFYRSTLSTFWSFQFIANIPSPSGWWYCHILRVDDKLDLVFLELKTKFAFCEIVQ